MRIGCADQHRDHARCCGAAEKTSSISERTQRTTARRRVGVVTTAGRSSVSYSLDIEALPRECHEHLFEIGAFDTTS